MEHHLETQNGISPGIGNRTLSGIRNGTCGITMESFQRLGTKSHREFKDKSLQGCGMVLDMKQIPLKQFIAEFQHGFKSLSLQWKECNSETQNEIHP